MEENHCGAQNIIALLQFGVLRFLREYRRVKADKIFDSAYVSIEAVRNLFIRSHNLKLTNANNRLCSISTISSKRY